MDPNPTLADAMDTDGAIAGPIHDHGGGQAPANPWSLLLMARQLIDQGKPSLAQQMILEAKRAQGGENATVQTLQCARELYRNKLHENAAADELASLFAECAIADSQPPPYPNQQQSLPPYPNQQQSLPRSSLMLMDNANDTSILAMSGRKQIMLDAFSDESSFICLKCGGLVSKLRKDEHLACWCGID